MSKQLPATKHLFQFSECITMVMPTGAKASNLREFLYILKGVDKNVIFHHLYQFFQKHDFQIWDYPNDFARWAAESLNDFALAEKLSNLDPYRYYSIEELREIIVDIIEEHIWEIPSIPWARPGFEFYFNDSLSIVLPTQIVVNNLSDFEKALTQVSSNSIYFHFFESRIRLHKDTDDFSLWIEDNFNCPQAVKKIRNIDYYLCSLEEIRQLIIDIIREEITSYEQQN